MGFNAALQRFGIKRAVNSPCMPPGAALTPPAPCGRRARSACAKCGRYAAAGALWERPGCEVRDAG